MIFWKILKIIWWHKKTFPNFTWEEQLAKICEESIEFQEAYFFKDADEATEEGADVIIASLGALRYKEIWEFIENKMKKNKKRKWRRGHHVSRG